MEHKAEEGHPGGPGLRPGLPQHRASGYRLPVPHHQLGKDEELGMLAAQPETPRLRGCSTSTMSITPIFMSMMLERAQQM